MVCRPADPDDAAAGRGPVGELAAQQMQLAKTDPMVLQQRHVRLSLIITPVITARDDRGGKISALTLNKALVLCMP